MLPFSCKGCRLRRSCEQCGSLLRCAWRRQILNIARRLGSQVPVRSMFVARSYSYTGQQRKSDKDEKTLLKVANKASHELHRGFGWRPESFNKTAQQQHKENANALLAAPGSRRRQVDHDTSHAGAPASDSHHPTPSQPVAVPSRPSSRHKSTVEPSSRHTPPKRATSHSSLRSYGSATLAPSVAALLADTTIPRRKTFPRQRPRPKPKPKPLSRRISFDEVVGEWQQAEFEHGTPPGVSPIMDTLLSPPGEEPQPLYVKSDDELPEAPESLSTSSTPALDSDSVSGISWSLRSTSENSLHTHPHKASMSVSSPSSFDSSHDHPLLVSPVLELPDDSSEEDETWILSSVNPGKTPTRSVSRTSSTSGSSSPRKSSPATSFLRKSSLKSNLTASLSSLRNNISRTFSNFAAPSTSAIASGDYVTWSLLGTPYNPEMRPRPMSGAPTAQMRRYMNPHAFQPYDLHKHSNQIVNADLEYVAAANAAGAEARAMGDPHAPAAPEIDVIPLDTYVKMQSRKTHGPATEAARPVDPVDGKSSQQRREPRENPEFLRIAVLEMQMRRAGKMEGPLSASFTGAGGLPGVGAAGAGRRGWFLPPRADNIALEAKATGRGPSKRWLAVAA